MKLFIIIICAIFLSAARPAFAETIILNNGQIIQGEVIESTGHSLKVKVDGATREISAYEIRKVIKEGENLPGECAFRPYS